MNLTWFTKAQIIILEGVPGAGKTTLQEKLRLSTDGRAASFFPEEALLFGWIHAWLPGIDELRIALMHRIIDHIETTLAESPEHLFVLNRFHISYLIFAKSRDMEAYESLISRLRELEVLVVVPQLCPEMVVDRAMHIERVDPLWQAHLNRRLEESGFKDISEMYLSEQKNVRDILAMQQLPYEIIESL